MRLIRDSDTSHRSFSSFTLEPQQQNVTSPLVSHSLVIHYLTATRSPLVRYLQSSFQTQHLANPSLHDHHCTLLAKFIVKTNFQKHNLIHTPFIHNLKSHACMYIISFPSPVLIQKSFKIFESLLDSLFDLSSFLL